MKSKEKLYEQAEDTANDIAEGAERSFGKLRDLTKEGGEHLVDAANDVASSFNQLLSQRQLKQFSSLIKRHPLQSVGLGLGIGFLLGKALRRA